MGEEVFSYRISKGKIEITGVSGEVSRLELPPKIDGFPVAQIARKAFLSRKNLQAVKLPDTLEEIGDWAFAYCDGLRRVELPNRPVTFGRSVFLDCGGLEELALSQKAEGIGELLAMAVTRCHAYYLLDIREAGSREWLAKLDAKILEILHSSDTDGYSKQVLCGEEDYGSTDLEAYMTQRRKGKARIALLRLLYPVGLEDGTRAQLQRYVTEHTKGCKTQETWEVLRTEYGNERKYYELFADLGCLREDNIQDILTDLGEDCPEMKAYFLKYQREQMGYRDFFADLEL